MGGDSARRLLPSDGVLGIRWGLKIDATILFLVIVSFARKLLNNDKCQVLYKTSIKCKKKENIATYLRPSAEIIKISNK